jgi:hypothetical protein
MLSPEGDRIIGLCLWRRHSNGAGIIVGGVHDDMARLIIEKPATDAFPRF